MYVEVGAWSGRTYPPGAVVVGYNGKDHSRAAVAWAAHEATRRGVPLVVLHAANYPGMIGEPGPGLHHRDPGALEAAEEMTGQGVAEAVAAHPGLVVVGATEVAGAARALAEASDGAALVVVGSRGHGRVIGALRASVAFEVATRASSPVVVVTQGSASRTVEPEHRVVVGTDGSAAADVAVRFAAARSAADSAALHIVTATGAHQTDDVDQGQLRASAHRIAESAAQRSRRTHPGLTVTTGVDDRPADQALVDASTDAGLVVVGTRGRGPFTGMLLGSVSHAVIHRAASPVVVVGEGAACGRVLTAAAATLVNVDETEPSDPVRVGVALASSCSPAKPAVGSNSQHRRQVRAWRATRAGVSRECRFV